MTPLKARKIIPTHLDDPLGDDFAHLRRESLLDCVEVAARRRLVALLRRQQILEAAILQKGGIGACVRVELGDAGRLQRRLLRLIAATTCCRRLLIRRIFHINVVLVLDIVVHCFVARQIHRSDLSSVES